MSQIVERKIDGKANRFVVADSTLKLEFDNFLEKSEYMEKVEFEDCNGASWSLQIRRKGLDDENKTSNGIFDELLIKKRSYRTNFGITINGFEPKTDFRYKLEISSDRLKKNYSSESFLPLLNLIPFHEIEELLVNDSITFKVRLVIDCIRAPLHRSKFHAPAVAAKALIDGVSIILTDEALSDFTFIVQGKEFKLHKAILAAASPVMRKLFTANFREAEANKCIVNHVEPDIFELLVRFIYSAEIPENINKVAKPLYTIADYYEVESLMQICEKEINETLSIANAYDTFVWAHKLDIGSLKFDSWQIIKRQILKIFVPFKKEPSLFKVQRLMHLKEQENALLKDLKKVDIKDV